jgi:hypothetical protein
LRVPLLLEKTTLMSTKHLVNSSPSEVAVVGFSGPWDPVLLLEVRGMCGFGGLDQLFCEGLVGGVSFVFLTVGLLSCSRGGLVNVLLLSSSLGVSVASLEAEGCFAVS